MRTDPKPGADPAGDDAPRPTDEAVFRMNLDTFGGRVARLCALLRRGRLTADSCFLAIAQLWIQLAHSHRVLDDRPGGEAERAADAPER